MSESKLSTENLHDLFTCISNMRLRSLVHLWLAEEVRHVFMPTESNKHVKAIINTLNMDKEVEEKKLLKKAKNKDPNVISEAYNTLFLLDFIILSQEDIYQLYVPFWNKEIKKFGDV